MRLLPTFAILLMTFSHLSWAKKTRLSYGGEVFLNTKKWEFIQTKSFTPNIPNAFVSKSIPELKGWLIGGTPDSIAKCEIKKNLKEFTVCHNHKTKDSTVFHQITLTRQLDKKAFQNYLISFSFSSDKEDLFSAQVNEFVKDLARKPK